MKKFEVVVNTGEEVTTLTEALNIETADLDSAEKILNDLCKEIVGGKHATQGSIMQKLADSISQEQALLIISSSLSDYALNSIVQDVKFDVEE